MNDFERQYYESEDFWKDTLQDPLNKLRIEETVAMVPSDVGSLLDAGCGNGIFLNKLRGARPKLNLVGTDRSETALRYLTTEKKVGSIDAIAFEDKSFDCVTCLEVIEHLPFDIYEKSLDELARVTKKYLIISVPHQEDLEDDVNQCPQCKGLFNSNLHFRSFTKEKLNALFETRGFKTITTKTLGDQYQLKGHRLYSRLVYPNNRKVFMVAICPICGFTRQQPNENGPGNFTSNNVSFKKTILSKITYLPKLLWPKEHKHYWVMSLFVKP